MDISIPADLEQFIEEQVKAGQFNSPSDVVSEALRTLKFQQEAIPRGVLLEQLIAEGQADADRGDLLDGDNVFQDIKGRNERRTSGA